MEMHQIRYFLALAHTLNFTQAARECNVSQPALTRAIKNLEVELGSELIRRERSRTHLTELGRILLPSLQQCFDSAVAAKKQAEAFVRGGVAPLQLGLTYTTEIELITEPVSKIKEAFADLTFDYVRGGQSEIAEALKSGEIEIAVAGPLNDDWERLDSWIIQEEDFVLGTNPNGSMGLTTLVSIDDLNEYRALLRPYCDHFKETLAVLEQSGFDPTDSQSITHDNDIASMVTADIGVTIIPRSLATKFGLHAVTIEGLGITRRIFLHTISGRHRTRPVSAFINLLRSMA